MNEFGENPFRNLVIQAVEPAEQSATSSALPVTPADSAMFQKAYETLDRMGRTRPASGFRIAEHCRMPVIEKKKPSPMPKPEISQPEVAQEDEFALAMRQVTPIRKKGRSVIAPPKLSPPRVIHTPTLDDFMAGKLEFAISGSDEYLEGHVVGLDELILTRLREGQFSPEAHYDLHGLNSEQAFESLKEFIHTAWLKDLRTVLIITGRGRNSPAGQSILRQKLQLWLTREPFKRVTLAFCTAKPHDGGPGSIYVLLRRARKKGKIAWQRQYWESDSD